jgi:SpoVK/Ycf46/Vps4 family AAA+-type ATPase
MGGLYRAIGVLSKGHLIETDRSGLVAGFVGQTAIKTNEIIEKALGGILFIDEAYALATAEGNDFGHEAVEALLKQMEDNRADLVIIVAGYDDLMAQFINSNPGLQSRFNRYFAFEDYNGGELLSIFDGLCEKNEYVLDDDAKAFAKEYFLRLYDNRDENFGNARDVRNFFETVISVHSDRVSLLEKPTRADLISVIKFDLEKAGSNGSEDEESE